MLAQHNLLLYINTGILLNINLSSQASQMWCLGRYLPLMIGTHIPPDDEKWQLYLLLLDIVDIIFAEVTTADKAVYLSNLIADHHSRFVQLYPHCSVIPKMHYILHYPRTMARYNLYIHFDK